MGRGQSSEAAFDFEDIQRAGLPGMVVLTWAEQQDEKLVAIASRIPDGKPIRFDPEERQLLRKVLAESETTKGLDCFLDALVERVFWEHGSSFDAALRNQIATFGLEGDGDDDEYFQAHVAEASRKVMRDFLVRSPGVLVDSDFNHPGAVGKVHRALVTAAVDRYFAQASEERFEMLFNSVPLDLSDNLRDDEILLRVVRESVEACYPDGEHLRLMPTRQGLLERLQGINGSPETLNRGTLIGKLINEHWPSTVDDLQGAMLPYSRLHNEIRRTVHLDVLPVA